MADPTKKPIEPKKVELSDDELNNVTGGAIDAFLDFTRSGETTLPSERPKQEHK